MISSRSRTPLSLPSLPRCHLLCSPESQGLERRQGDCATPPLSVNRRAPDRVGHRAACYRVFILVVFQWSALTPSLQDRLLLDLQVSRRPCQTTGGAVLLILFTLLTPQQSARFTLRLSLILFLFVSPRETINCIPSVSVTFASPAPTLPYIKCLINIC